MRYCDKTGLSDKDWATILDVVNVFDPNDIAHVYPQMGTPEFMQDVQSAFKAVLAHVERQQIPKTQGGEDVPHWEKQLEEYEPLPTYEPFPEFWINYAKEVGRDPDEYPFFALTARSMQYSWGANVGIPLINEVASNISGHRGVIINRTRARELGLEEGDPVEIESVTGITRGNAVLRAGIRPDTILMIGQFDHWATPYAKDLNLPSLNSVTTLSLALTDATGSSADLAMVRIRKVDGERRVA